MIVINFKTYQQGSGEEGFRLLSLIEEVALGTETSIIPAVQVIDLKEATEKSRLPIWVQNIDPITYGSHTGLTLAEEAVRIGAKGTLLNHSENKYEDLEKLQYSIVHCRSIGLRTLVLASSVEEFHKVCDLKPDFVGYEPPELIGSTTVSVAQAQPKIISHVADMAKAAGIPLLVGAGVHSKDDVKRSLELGAMGVLLATDIVKAEDPKKELLDLLEGFK